MFRNKRSGSSRVRSTRNRNLAISAAVIGASSLSAKSFAQLYTFTTTFVAGNTNATWSGGTTTGWNAVPTSGATTALAFVGVGTATSTTSVNDIQNLFQLNSLTITGAGPTGLTANNGTLTISGDSLDFVANGATLPTVVLSATGTFSGNLGSSEVNSANYFVSNNITFGANTTFSGTGNAVYDFTGNLSGSGNIIQNGSTRLVLGAFNATNLNNTSYTYSGNIIAQSTTGTISFGLAYPSSSAPAAVNGFFTTGALELNGGSVELGDSIEAFGSISVSGSNVNAFNRVGNSHGNWYVNNTGSINLTGVNMPGTESFYEDAPGGISIGTCSVGYNGTLGNFSSGTMTIGFTDIGQAVLTMQGLGSIVMTGNTGAVGGNTGNADYLISGTVAYEPTIPVVSGTPTPSAVNITGQTGGAFIRAQGGAEYRLDDNGNTSITLTLGSLTGSGTTAFSQNARVGDLVFQAGQGLSAMGSTDVLRVLEPATDSYGTISTAIPLTNGMLQPWILVSDGTAASSGGTQAADFATYIGTGIASDPGIYTVTGAVAYFAANPGTATYSGSTLSNYSTNILATSAAASTAIDEVNDGGALTTVALTSTTYAYAVRLDNGTITIPNAASLTIGNGFSQAGLILNGGTLASASGTGTLLLSGSAQQQVYTSLANGTITASINAGINFSKFGPGTLFIGNAGTFNSSGTEYINQGAIDIGAMTAGTIANTGGTRLTTGNLVLQNGVLEGSGNFNRVAGSGNYQVQINDGGFAARGGNLNVNLGGLATPATLTWGLGSFLTGTVGGLTTGAPTGVTAADGGIFVFGAPAADSQVIFANPIALGATSPYYWHQVYVNQGTLGTDSALLNGVISDTVGSAATHGFMKTGPGTLYLGAANTYTGPTSVYTGTMGLTPTGSLGDTAITVNTGATLYAAAGTKAGTITNNGASLTTLAGAGINLADGTVGSFTVNGTGNALTLGGGTLGIDVQTAGVDDVYTAAAGTVSGTTLVNVTASGVLTPGSYPIITAAGGLTNSGVFEFASLSSFGTINSGGYAYPVSFSSDTNDENLVIGVGTPTPEPGSCAIALGGAALGMLRRRRRAVKV